MKNIKKICVVSGSRSEYGLLYWLLKEIELNIKFKLQFIVTGSHLSKEFGETYKQIKSEGFKIDKKIEILKFGNTNLGITKSIGSGIMQFAKPLKNLNPDIIVILGDRYEILALAIAALINKIPIAHIHGGEITEGAFDDSIRHSITKMSHLHFTSLESYRKRVIQLGENPNLVFNVGAIGMDGINKNNLLDKKTFEKKINFKLFNKNILVTYHPATLENNETKNKFMNILTVLKKYSEVGIIFTKSNADPDGLVINKLIDKFVQQNKNSICLYSLGQTLYHSALNQVDAVVGNSSSGIIEVPSYCIATVNIGDRQKGREKPHSVIDTDYSLINLTKSIDYALSDEIKKKLANYNNPYQRKNVSKNILKIISKNINKNLTQKKFYDYNFDY